ncbi:uncharacterized protein LOC112510509 [Cynara cardunculus var. scolymus]|uniref:Uncharacterized protein n=1 Tax=Cynara cardunculus var. scolymus TaxID=59895 RepID=A0A124SGS1_CYNCS|nr:uncharacterized protein LOC112510509 [Cynara cardunculus var. scolymus]KVI07261.1 hypothetical protein Ccrd_014365 [Cynara cardunculus var. scolymus]
MSRREGKGPPSRDLLVCFPTRAHLTLMPKAVSSPRRHHQNHLRKSMRGGGGGHASPYLKQMSSENLSEPTSPKVTCAGQIKVRPRAGACKNWQTVMEEIERLHINRKTKKPNWVEALGFKKEVMQFLACLRRIKFDFRCMRSFSHVDVTSDDEEGDNDKEIDQNQDIQDHYDHEEVSSRTVFSKWFMVLQENNQDCGVFSKDEKSLTSEETDQDPRPCLPPANALLLMRCRSAPAKSWMEEKQEEEEQEKEDDDDDGHDEKVEEEEHADDDDGDDDEKMEKKEKKRKSLMELMKINDQSDFYKLSSDVVKETWVIGGIQKDPFSRSRSWKR